ncbi:hypothetical protein JD507_12110 [Aeromonas jandaei]|uniref:P-loop NTPase fold protein n=1 Tax=Aeromonas jandaei TaxID=650 RepID=UPI00191EAEE7|nr:P-loop NTPase fold protein [Aeromonas jandaei]MBL0545956.1 hypothetical protein [Aeromonas jandaei]
MGNPNSHIEEFLKYYYSFEQEPGYAVLLKGKWGTGKTWFIKKTLNALSQQSRKYLYVSLYGITSFDEIEDEFFKQLHPLLSSKSMTLTGKIAKGLLKATLKIDLDNDGKADGSLSAQAPELNLPDYLTNTSGFVIVFDDLERASINLEALLGYINHYVEHQGYKVIIVANEEEILTTQEKQEDVKLAYRRIKEKLVGKTFEVHPNLQGALVDFISDVRNKDVQLLCEKHINLISELYEHSKYQNLRHLKQALWDFERFLTFVSSDASSKEGLLEHLLKVFLILSFEIKSGTILPNDILNFKTTYLSGLINKDSSDKKETPYQKVSNKYKNVNLSDLLIEESIWIDFFDKGCCSRDKVQESLEKSEYYRTESTPDWVRLWHSIDLSDDEFCAVLESVRNDYYAMKHTELGIVRHITGIFLWLSKIQLIKEKTSDILNFAVSYISHLKAAHLLKYASKDINTFREHESWGGLGFHERESNEFKALNEHIDKLSEQAIIEDYPVAGEMLVTLIDDDPYSFYKQIVLCNHPDNFYYKIPILKYIDPDVFVEKIISASPNSRRTACYAFSERYRFDDFNTLLLPELPWLHNVVEKLERKRHEREGKISGYQLQHCINTYFIPAVQTLEETMIKNRPDSAGSNSEVSSDNSE